MRCCRSARRKFAGGGQRAVRSGVSTLPDYLGELAGAAAQCDTQLVVQLGSGLPVDDHERDRQRHDHGRTDRHTIRRRKPVKPGHRRTVTK